MKSLRAISFLLILLISQPGFAQNNENEENKNQSIEVEFADEAAFVIDGKKLTLGDAIRLVLTENRDTLSGAYDVAMSDSDYRKYGKKYSPFINLEGGTKYSEYPEEMGPMVGADERITDATLALSKMFSTGTTLSAGLTHQYTKITQRPVVIPGMGEITFGQAEYYRPVLFASVQQELLKNSFGYSERRQREMLKNYGKIQREALIYQLSGLVVQVVVDYWTVVISSSAVDNAKLKLRETKRVRNITAANVRLGLAERFDLNYYNTLVAAAEATFAATQQQYRDTVRKLLRTLNFDKDTEITGNAVVANKLPIIDESESLKIAFEKRADYQNALLSLKNAQMELEMYENEGLPSVTAEFNVSALGQKDEMNEAYSDTTAAKYPSWEARLKVTYPLDDSEQKTNERNARFKLEQAKLMLDKYKREVRDDVVSAIERIKTYYTMYEKARESRKQAEIYYRRLYQSMKRGRFTAATVKNALDAMVDSRQRELEALIQYNISILEFDVARNYLFDRYQIKVDNYIPKEK